MNWNEVNLEADRGKQKQERDRDSQNMREAMLIRVTH